MQIIESKTDVIKEISKEETVKSLLKARCNAARYNPRYKEEVRRKRGARRANAGRLAVVKLIPHPSTA